MKLSHHPVVWTPKNKAEAQLHSYQGSEGRKMLEIDGEDRQKACSENTVHEGIQLPFPSRDPSGAEAFYSGTRDVFPANSH